MGITQILPIPKLRVPNGAAPTRITQTTSISCTTISISLIPSIVSNSSSPNTKTKPHSNPKNKPPHETIGNHTDEAANFPTMSEITKASKAQKIHLRLQTIGPFFRITAKSLETGNEIGRAEGAIRVWFGGRILHLDSIKLRRETLGMERSIFGIGLFIGAVAVRYGYDCGCKTAELLAINDSDLYHSKLVRFYKRIGFKSVREVTGSWIGDIPDMLVWGGVGTRMDATITDLLLKWCTRFKPRN